MTSPGRQKISFIALYPSEFLSDLLLMPALARGVYISIILKIYNDGGRILYDVNQLANLCGLTVKEFEKAFEQIRHKFRTKKRPNKTELSHKRCTIEINKARKRMQVGQTAGLMSAQKRKNSVNVNATPVEHQLNSCSTTRRDQTETRQDKTRPETYSRAIPDIQPPTGPMANTMKKVFDSFQNSCPSSDSASAKDSVSVEMALRQVMAPKTASDLSALRNFAGWCASEVLAGHRSMEFYKRAVDLAVEARQKGRNRFAYFFNLARREFGYIPATKKI